MDEERVWTYKCSRAIEDALTYGKALLKVISPNDVGLTGGHQGGYYLPKSVWNLFTDFPPTDGENNTTEVSVLWDNGSVTDSRVKWYGRGTRSEYRMTRFGNDFPYLTYDSVGDLLVLIPKSYTEFNCHVLDVEADIEEIQAALGVYIQKTWAVFLEDAPEPTEGECVDGYFSRFVTGLDDFPSGELFSQAAQEAIVNCLKKLNTYTPDKKLLEFVDAEYKLFRSAERKLCLSEIFRPFRDVEDFLKTAKTITQRRVARAGRSLENHVEYILKESGIPHKMRPSIDGEPDIVIPSEAAYNDTAYPLDKLFIVGVKTTCKDRWRQVLDEGHRQPKKHLITLQKGISGPQLQKMTDADLTLVVPKELHKLYPDKGKGHEATILNVDSFLQTVKTALQ